MLNILDSLIATAAVVLGLSLVVQALQQIFKQWLDLKAEYMFNELLSLFSEYPEGQKVLSGFLPTKSLRGNADEFSLKIVGELEKVINGMGFRDIHMVENLDTKSFVDLLNSLPLAQTQDAALQSKFKKAVDDATHWFELTKAAFQEHYERRMKYWSFGISAVLAIALNANLLDIYQEFSHNQTLRDAAVKMGEQLTSTSRDSIIVRSTSEKKDTAFVAAVPDSIIVKKIQSNASNIRQMLDEESFQVMGWSGARIERYADLKWYWGMVRMLFGWLGMTLLVSLGAPFWYDALKTVMGIKNSFQKNN